MDGVIITVGGLGGSLCLSLRASFAKQSTILEYLECCRNMVTEIVREGVKILFVLIASTPEGTQFRLLRSSQ